jgi:hypothetical protein
VELPLACCLVKRQVAGTENFMEKEEWWDKFAVF